MAISAVALWRQEGCLVGNITSLWALIERLLQLELSFEVGITMRSRLILLLEIIIHSPPKFCLGNLIARLCHADLVAQQRPTALSR